jgi:hypothetical protein
MDAEIDFDEKNILYYLAGHTIQSILKKKCKSCGSCLLKALTFDCTVPDYASLQRIKDFTGDSLVKCSECLFTGLFLEAECFFRLYITNQIELFLKNRGILSTLMTTFFKDRPPVLPMCHYLDQVICKRFFEIRLHQHGKDVRKLRQEKRNGCERSSKSTEMRALAKEVKSKKRKKK